MIAFLAFIYTDLGIFIVPLLYSSFMVVRLIARKCQFNQITMKQKERNLCTMTLKKGDKTDLMRVKRIAKRLAQDDLDVLVVMRAAYL